MTFISAKTMAPKKKAASKSNKASATPTENAGDDNSAPATGRRRTRSRGDSVASQGEPDSKKVRTTSSSSDATEEFENGDNEVKEMEQQEIQNKLHEIETALIEKMAKEAGYATFQMYNMIKRIPELNAFYKETRAKVIEEMAKA